MAARESMLSGAERSFILGGADENFRADGRSKLDYREILVDIDVLPNASGSSSVKLGATEVLVSVKAEIGETSPLAKNVGTVIISVECSSNAYPHLRNNELESLSLSLSSALSKHVTRRTIDLKSLCIIPGEQCWVLHVDALILQYDGNLEDILSMALKAALYDTKIPKLIVTKDENGGGTFEVSDDPSDVKRLEMGNFPLIVTYNLLSDQFVVDATIEEEICSDVKVVVAVDKTGKICSIQKCGNKGLKPEHMEGVIRSAGDLGKTLNATLMKTLKSHK